MKFSDDELATLRTLLVLMLLVKSASLQASARLPIMSMHITKITYDANNDKMTIHIFLPHREIGLNHGYVSRICAR
jgi:hypothetical protein